MVRLLAVPRSVCPSPDRGHIWNKGDHLESSHLKGLLGPLFRNHTVNVSVQVRVTPPFPSIPPKQWEHWDWSMPWVYSFWPRKGNQTGQDMSPPQYHWWIVQPRVTGLQSQRPESHQAASGEASGWLRMTQAGRGLWELRLDATGRPRDNKVNGDWPVRRGPLLFSC